MSNFLSRAIGFILLFFALTSSALAQDGDKARAPIAEKVSFAPIFPPKEFSITNRGGPLDLIAGAGYLINKDIEKNRIPEFQKLLVDHSLNMSEEAASALQMAFKEAGHPLMPLLEAKYNPEDPSELDYKATKSNTDLILVATISEVGLASTRFSTQFVPKLTMTFELVSKKTEDSDYSEKIQYGGGAKKLTEDEIPSDPKFSFGSYGEAMENPDLVVESFREGLQLLARLATQQMLKHIK
jgi:hypothetical protein